MSTKFYNNNGAVSVFLVMVLVPVLTIVSLFVDLSRVKLGEGLVASAEDVALNTLLTQYDADLKEYYGMIGSCQDISDYYETAKSCFENSLKSQHYTDTELNTLWAEAGKVISPSNPSAGDIVDLLQISEDTAGVTVNAVDGANLANPTLLKTQIVEFMKYRMPINLATGLLSKVLGKMKDSSDEQEDAKTDNEIAELKQDFLTEENELLGKLKKAYDYIVKYEAKNITKSYCIGVKDEVNNVEGKYKEFHKKMVKDLYNTEGLTEFKHVTYNLASYASKTYSEYDDKKDNNEIKSLVVNSIYIYGDWTTQFFNKKAELEAAMKEITPSDIGDGDAQGYDIQYWESVYNKITTLYGEFKTLAQKMYDSYGKMIYIRNLYGSAYMSEVINLRAVKDKYFYDYVNADYAAREDNGPKTYSSCYDLAAKQINATHDKYFGSTLTADTNDTYITVMLKLEQISKDNINEINSDTLSGDIKGVHDYLVGSDNKSGEKGHIDKAREHLNSAKAILNPETLSTAIEEYKKKYEAYKKKVLESDTAFAEEEEARINELKDVVENVTVDSVKALNTRLTNVDSELSKITKYIDSLKYQTTQVININKYASLKTAAKNKVKSENIPVKNSDLTNYVNSTFSFSKQGSVDLTLNIVNSNHPELKDVEQPVLLKWMREKFVYKNVEPPEEMPRDDYDEDTAKEDFDGEDSNMQDKADSQSSDETKEDDSKNTSIGNIVKKYESVKSEFPSKLSGSNEVNFGDILINFPLLAYDLATDFDATIHNLRDSLYTTDYVMNMFTHDTFERERIIDAAVAKDKTKYNKLSWSQVDSVINGEKENWTSNEDYEYTYNKTLTNKMFSKDNNFAYGAEVEYILKGGSNSSNIACVYGNIFALRVIFNTPICFKEFWNDADLNAFAAFIQGITYGIVPQPLTKTLMILITICVESGADIAMLKKGLDVPVVKLDKKYIAVESAVVPIPVMSNVSAVTYNSMGLPNPIALSYEDYLTIFLLLGLNDGEEAEVAAIYKRIGDVIQANMRKITGDSGKNYKLSNTVELFEIEANMQVDPLFLDLPFMNEFTNKPTASSPSGWCKFKYKTVRGY